MNHEQTESDTGSFAWQQTNIFFNEICLVVAVSWLANVMECVAVISSHLI